jgi:Flp pilus assembly protein TadG
MAKGFRVRPGLHMSTLIAPTRRHLLARFGADRRGTTAIEFAAVVAPFLLLMLGIMTVGLQFFTTTSLENGVAQASRKIRTGQAQKAGKTFADFRQMVCDEAGSYIKCNSNLVIHVKSGKVFADLDPPTSCLTNGSLTPSSGTGSDPLTKYSGSESATVLVTACYAWDFGGTLWQDIWNMFSAGPWSTSGSPRVQGKTVIQATSTFRTEPYQ